MFAESANHPASRIYLGAEPPDPHGAVVALAGAVAAAVVGGGLPRCARIVVTGARRGGALGLGHSAGLSRRGRPVNQ
ncbi:hypothetical protein Ade02nite_66560 [Paractinoplanes deccanensis]|uniref:Uncharacterized protein n=1 Tax=Paractinoplanes deccanensis TaxID=113561 RepID=A0ABQ3YE06_9ACTN|nr:hypothetical protein Ade02nite_66560 [Actinoplanes deccanensis]